MRNQRSASIAAILASALGLLAASPAAAEPQRYPLHCVFAPGTHATYKIAGHAGGGFVVEVFIEIAHAAGGAAAGNVPPGSCAWEDRGMNAEEPKRLALSLRPGRPQQAQIYFSCEGTTCQLDNYFGFPELGWLEHTLAGGGFIITDAYTNGAARVLAGNNLQSFPATNPPPGARGFPRD